MNPADLQDLVDTPRETLEIELKEWLDLNDKEKRANLARHICALANHGGGYIVFGFRDDLSPEETPPNAESNYTRDNFSSMVKKYLGPTIQCEVAFVTTRDGRGSHAIVWVPGIAGTPVCAIADGPQDGKGQPQGIRIATHYTRSVGPASVPINTPEQWAPVIRRCVLSDRDAILSMLQSILTGRIAPAMSTETRLEQWHALADQRFSKLVAEHPDLGWPVSYQDNHVHFSYTVVHDPEECIALDPLRETLETVNREVRDLVWTGWSMFYLFSRDPIAPYVVPVTLGNREIEALETNLMVEPYNGVGLPDFWRFSIGGDASIVQPYFEDDPRVTSGHPGWRPGGFFSPRLAIRLVAELVRHARGIAARFESATSVEFLCTWRGLANRQFADLEPGIYWNPRVARVDQRTSKGSWRVSDLLADWPAIVANLVSPVTVLFSGFTVRDDWVLQLSKDFRR